MMAITKNDEKIHLFEASGLGKAPFQLVGFYSIPSASLAEQNPQAYHNELALMPKGISCGTCCYCGTSLKNNFIVRSADDKTFVVGCDCVEKIGDKGLINAIKLLKRQQRIEEKQRRLDEQNKELSRRYAERDANERAANNGFTVAELKEQQHRQYIEQVVEIVAPITNVLHRSYGDFAAQMCEHLNKGALDVITPNMQRIILEIVSKSFGRKNSAQYNEAYDEMSMLFEQARSLKTPN